MELTGCMPRCTCVDWLETELPCKHIFHCLKVQQMTWNDFARGFQVCVRGTRQEECNFRVYRCVIIALKLCRTHALFNCDEACLERKDPTYRASVDSDGEQIDADTVKDVLNFVDATMDEGTEMAEVAPKMKEGLAVEVGMETEVKQGDPVVQMMRELNRVGRGIREQCKLIMDLTYELESLDCGQYVREELTGLYQYLYKNGQEHRGLPHLRKEHLRHRPLFKSKHK